MGDWTEISAGGQSLRAYLARPDADEGVAVLVLHAWWGLNETFQGVCDRLAEEGFIALAPDLYGDGRVNATFDEAEASVNEADWDAMVDRGEAGLDALLGLPGVLGRQVGVVGFSMGVQAAMGVSARREEVGASVLFYGASDAEVAESHAAFLGHFVPGDEWEPDEGVDAMEAAIREAGREVVFHRYPGTKHWFFEPDRPEFDREAAELAWSRTLEFLRENLGPIGA